MTAPSSSSPLAVSQGDHELLPMPSEQLERARDSWLSGDWVALVHPELEGPTDQGERAQLAILGAAAALQNGDRRSARELAQRAWMLGCPRAVMADVLLSSARQALGRAAAVAQHDERAMRHFEAAIPFRRNSSENRRVAQARSLEMQGVLMTRIEIVTKRRKAGQPPTGAAPAGWLSDLVAHCLTSPDVHEAVDWVLGQVLGDPQDKVRFLMRLAEHFQGLKDPMTATHFLVTAKEILGAAGSPGLRTDLASRLVALDQAGVAMDLVVAAAVAEVRAVPHSEAVADAVLSAYTRARDHEQRRIEHGHDLLLSYLRANLRGLRQRAGTRTLSMVEIGTTRENVPGQGSTRKLAEFCQKEGVDFVTVDMDPHNSRVAEHVFRELGATTFRAVTMKGEDYLRERTDLIDFVFLDAYDFDHGKHSDLRQARYQRFLGARIDEAACHQMHLDCARSVIRLLSSIGVVCLDDTWLDPQKHWTAKGTLAMPFLLENGYEVVEARNRAALLRPRLAGQGGA